MLATASSAANNSYIVARNVVGNSNFNNIGISTTSTVSAAQTVTMTYASTGNQRITGTSTVRFKLPDATYLTAGDSFKFNNNSTGIVSVYKADNTTLVSDIPGGGLMDFLCMDNSTTNGLWDYHAYMSNAATSGTTGTSLPGTLTTGVISNALGAVGAPSYTFTGDLDTGMWSSAGGFVNFSTDGALGLTLSAGASSPVLRVGKQTDTPFSNASSLTLATGTGNSGRLATFCYNNANPPLHISVGQGSGIPSIMWGALEQTGVNNTQIYALASTTTAKISSDASVARAFTLQVAPAGTINTQITWTDAAVVTSAGAWTLGPATTSTTHIMNSRYFRIRGAGTTNETMIIFGTSDDSKTGSIGQENSAGNQIITSSAAYSLNLSSYSDINFSSNNASAIHGKVSAGAWTLGAASTTPTHQLNTANASTVGAAGGASALPATPTGYITININGTDRKIPYYAT
jgi:hypothetical protein